MERQHTEGPTHRCRPGRCESHVDLVTRTSDRPQLCCLKPDLWEDPPHPGPHPHCGPSSESLPSPCWAHGALHGGTWRLTRDRAGQAPCSRLPPAWRSSSIPLYFRKSA